MLNIGAIYLLMGQLDSAQYYLDQSYSYFEKIGNSSALYHAQTQIFELALRKGNIADATKQLHSMTDNLQAEPTLVDIRKNSYNIIMKRQVITARPTNISKKTCGWTTPSVTTASGCEWQKRTFVINRIRH